MGAAPSSFVGGRDLDALGSVTRWEARIARACQLAVERPAVSEPLNFYAELARLQLHLIENNREHRPGRDLAALIPSFLEELGRVGPPAFSNRLATLSSEESWSDLIETYWRTGGSEPGDDNAVRLFVIEAVLQPFAEVTPHEAPNRTSPTCPTCAGRPLLGVLREEGHGARRSLLCGLCLTEWPAMRLVCCVCGESTFDRLPVFRAEQVVGVRVDVCESCRTYLKTIDLTQDGSQVPIVDDLATLPLDLWARENGYRRARPNVLRL